MAQWRKIIVSGSNAELSHLSMSGDIDLTGNITGSSTSTGSFGYLAVSGDTTIGGNLTFGDSDTDFVSFSADITSDIIPDASDSYDLGSTGQRWNDVWVSGSLTANGGPHSLTTEVGEGGAIDIDADGALTIDGGSITIGGDSDVAVDIDSSTLDIDASGALTIDSATSIAIGANADKPIDIDSTTLDIDASDAITIDSTSTILISGDGGATFSDDTEALVYDGSGNVDFDTVGLDIDSSGAITIDGTSSLSIDVDAASNFNTSAGDITIDSEAGSVNIDGGESAANAIKIVASDGAGGIDIDAGSAGINVDSTGGITVGGTNATGVTLGKSDTTVTVAGSLDVNGTVTTIDSANTYIADKFMIIASGSTSDTDGGILIQNAAGAGYGLGYDSGIDRWVFDADLAHTATDIVPDAYVGVIQTGTTHGDSVAVPTYGGTTNGVGTIYIDTDAGDQGIWIYS